MTDGEGISRPLARPTLDGAEDRAWAVYVPPRMNFLQLRWRSNNGVIW
jgi:hypothetical protein